MQFYGGSPGQSQYDSKGFVPVFAPRFTGKVHNLFVMLFFPAIRGQSVTSIGPQVKMRKRFLNQDYWHKSAPIMRIKLAILMLGDPSDHLNTTNFDEFMLSVCDHQLY